MNIYELTKDIANVLKDLYDFVYNLLFYQITLFDLQFTIIESLGILAGVGLGIYVTIKIISIFA
jgi:hypothetical protein